MSRIFCPKCGNGATLSKVSVSVDANGAWFASAKKRPNLRGTRYSLPLPKGGRHAHNPILREDELLRKRHEPRAKRNNVMDVFNPEVNVDTWFKTDHSTVQYKGAAAVVAAGSRRNPNERRLVRKKK